MEKQENSIAILNSGAITCKEYREMATEAEEWLLTLPQEEFGIRQHFAGGVYSREITIPKGSVITGGVHKEECIIIVSSGELILSTEEGPKTIKAPASFIGEAGVKRVAVCVEECKWTTVHRYDGEELSADDMKQVIACDNYKLYDIWLSQQDYLKFVDDLGISQNDVLAMVLNTEDIVMFDEDTNIALLDSEMSGIGTFAECDFVKDGYIGKGAIGQNRTPLGRFTNHSNRPNVYPSVKEDYIVFMASRDIKKGEELTVDYREAIAKRGDK